MDYKIIEKNEAPEEVQEWIEKNKYEENHTIVKTNQRTYVIITRGEKRTGGYGIDISSVEEKDNVIYILVKYMDPDPEDIVIQTVTYPYIIVELEETEKEIRIIINK